MSSFAGGIKKRYLLLLLLLQTLNTRYTELIIWHYLFSERDRDTKSLCPQALTVSLGGIVSLVADQVLWSVVLASTEVLVQNGLGASGVAGLCIDGGTRHVRHHGVTTSPGRVRGVSEWVFLGCGLWEPHITSVSTELARLEGLGNILLDDNGTTCRVDEPRTCEAVSEWSISSRLLFPVRTLLHLADELLVEETASLLVEWAVDGDHITLCQHILELVYSSAANLLLHLGRKWLVVVVEELLAVKCLESAQNTLTNTAHSNGTDRLSLQVVLVLGNSGNVPVTRSDLLVSWNKVADQHENGHDDMFSDGHDVGARDLSNGNTAVGLVGSVEVDVIGTDTRSDGQLQVLGLGETLRSQVTGVETVGYK